MKNKQECCKKCENDDMSSIWCNNKSCSCHSKVEQKECEDYGDVRTCPKCKRQSNTVKLDEHCPFCVEQNNIQEDKSKFFITDTLTEQTAYEYLRVDLKIPEWQARLIAGKIGICAENEIKDYIKRSR